MLHRIHSTGQAFLKKKLFDAFFKVFTIFIETYKRQVRKFDKWLTQLLPHSAAQCAEWSLHMSMRKTNMGQLAE